MSSAPYDPYAALGLVFSESPSSQDIIRAYRKCALLYHPDKNRDREEWAITQFQLCARAYESLVDPESKSRIDAALHQFMETQIAIQNMSEERKKFKSQLEQREREFTGDKHKQKQEHGSINVSGNTMTAEEMEIENEELYEAALLESKRKRLGRRANSVLIEFPSSSSSGVDHLPEGNQQQQQQQQQQEEARLRALFVLFGPIAKIQNVTKASSKCVWIEFKHPESAVAACDFPWLQLGHSWSVSLSNGPSVQSGTHESKEGQQSETPAFRTFADYERHVLERMATM
jgi:curved DNA-binding protein CbpA